MNPIVLYIIKVSGAISLFYICYRYILSTDTYFIRNRFYLVGCILFSIIAPFIKITVKTITIQPFESYSPHLTTNLPIVETAPAANPLFFVGLKILLAIYIAGCAFFLIRLIWAYTSTIRIIINAERKKLYGFILAFTENTHSPFSLLKWLVIPKNRINHPDFENIVQHESIHSRQYHSVDLFLAEIMVAFQWFNPFVWMLKKAIVENHEYIVDKTLLNKGVNAQQYQYSLLSYATDKGGQLTVASHFNSNLLKKRIRMMNKNQSPRWHRIKNFTILIATTIVVLTTVSFETKVIAQSKQEEPILIVNHKKVTSSELQKVDPKNIKTITVLKDSSATNLYGKDGKNGVVIVEINDTSIKTGNWIYADHDPDSIRFNKIEITGYGKPHVIKDTRDKKPLVIVDGERVKADDFFGKSWEMEKMEMIKGEAAIALYGEEGKNGVFIYTSKKDNNEQTPNNHLIISSNDKKTPLYVLDGKIISAEEMGKLKPDAISNINVLKGEKAISEYGKKGKNGVIEIITKNGNLASKPLSVSFSQNPAKDETTVIINHNETDKTFYTIQVSNKMGVVVSKATTNQKSFVLSLSDLKDNMYVVSVTSENGNSNGSAILMVKK